MAATIKDGKGVVQYRGPKTTIEWLREQAEIDGTTPSTIISIAVRELKERQAVKTRALASADGAA